MERYSDDYMLSIVAEELGFEHLFENGPIDVLVQYMSKMIGPEYGTVDEQLYPSEYDVVFDESCERLDTTGKDWWHPSIRAGNETGSWCDEVWYIDPDENVCRLRLDIERSEAEKAWQ